MECQILFSRKNNKITSMCRLLNLARVVNVNKLRERPFVVVFLIIIKVCVCGGGGGDGGGLKNNLQDTLLSEGNSQDLGKCKCTLCKNVHKKGMLESRRK